MILEYLQSMNYAKEDADQFRFYSNSNRDKNAANDFLIFGAHSVTN